MAGRAISQIHESDMWTRGMHCCALTGQCAGVAAALAARSSRRPRALEAAGIQRELARQGVDLGSAAHPSEARSA